MMTGFKTIVDGLKRRDGQRRAPTSAAQKASSAKASHSDYEAGVRIGRESVQDLEKVLKKSK